MIVSIGRRTRVAQNQTAGALITITPSAPMVAVLGGLTDDATNDHRCAQLRAGSAYSTRSSAGNRRLSMLSTDPGAPDDPLPTNDPSARLVDITES